jgi:hypothetical protein
LDTPESSRVGKDQAVNRFEGRSPNMA